MNRCNKCLLPDNLPGSNFDTNNVCGWCRDGYPIYQTKGASAIANKFAGLDNSTGSADCLVGLSGGKDSTYALYRLATQYKLKVEAFIYIHDGSTEFSVQNAIESCKQLGVKLHKVSLPNGAHREAFLRYLKAWLEHPDSIAAGMTCVACKHLHILGSQLAAKRKIPYVIWSSTPFEYSPFLAIKHKGDARHLFKRESILRSGMQLVNETIRYPQFAHSIISLPITSILGCLAVFPNSAYLHYRYPSVKPLMFYSYERWEPKTILCTIQSKLAWKIPSRIKEDWHSDCLFNVFKEYMFQKMFGVSYTDAHLSNQIRHGYISREEAMTKLLESKRLYASAILPALKALKAEELYPKIDLSCFEMTGKC